MADDFLFHKDMFIVEIDGVESAKFKSCEGLGLTKEEVTYNEGGRDRPHKRPGKKGYGNITLSRGFSKDKDLYNWSIGNEIRNFSLIQQDREGNTLKRWFFEGAFCVSWTVDGWDADSSEFLMESIEVACDQFTPES